MAYGRVFRIAPTGAFEVVAEYDGHPNGLRIHRDGRLFIADRAPGLMVMDPEARKIHMLLRAMYLDPDSTESNSGWRIRIR